MNDCPYGHRRTGDVVPRAPAIHDVHYFLARGCCDAGTFTCTGTGLYNGGNVNFEVKVDEKEEGSVAAPLLEASSVNAMATYTMGGAKLWSNPQDEASQSQSRPFIPRDGTGPNAFTHADREAATGGPLGTSSNWRFWTYAQRTGTLGAPVDCTCLLDGKTSAYITVFFVAGPPTPAWSGLEA